MAKDLAGQSKTPSRAKFGPRTAVCSLNSNVYCIATFIAKRHTRTNVIDESDNNKTDEEFVRPHNSVSVLMH